MAGPIQNSSGPAHRQKGALEILDDLQILFSRMDAAYQEAAAFYGFHCTGCENSCCRTLFFHHTHIEQHYLLKGLQTLERSLQDEIRRRAARAWRRIEASLVRKLAVRVMCPLNFQGRCRLYAHRPMICRLHGVPHQLRRPGKSVLHAPGCAAFTHRCGEMDIYAFDRTPFYTQLAMLERHFRAVLNIAPGRSVRLTIAQILAGDNLRVAGISPSP